MKTAMSQSGSLGTKCPTVDSSCKSKCNVCNRGREELPPKEARSEGKAKDGDAGFSKNGREEVVLPCQAEPGLSLSTMHVHMSTGLQGSGGGRVSKLLEDKPESTHGFELKWLELGHTGIVSKVSPEVLERG